MGGRQLELGGGAAVVVRTSAERPAPASSAAGRTIRDSPLWTAEHGLAGRVVTDPLEVEAIERQVSRRRPRPVLVLTLLVAGLLVGAAAPRLVVSVLLALFVLLVYVLVLTRKARP